MSGGGTGYGPPGWGHRLYADDLDDVRLPGSGPFHRGYRRRAVRALLDSIGRELRVRDALEAELQAQIHRLNHENERIKTALMAWQRAQPPTPQPGDPAPGGPARPAEPTRTAADPNGRPTRPADRTNERS